MTPDNQKETLDFLSARQLPYVCVDMPQGYLSSIPPVLATTSDLTLVRLHGHSDKWDSKDIYERFGYRYTYRRLGYLKRVKVLRRSVTASREPPGGGDIPPGRRY